MTNDRTGDHYRVSFHKNKLQLLFGVSATVLVYGCFTLLQVVSNFDCYPEVMNRSGSAVV